MEAAAGWTIVEDRRRSGHTERAEAPRRTRTPPTFRERLGRLGRLGVSLDSESRRPRGLRLLRVGPFVGSDRIGFGFRRVFSVGRRPLAEAWPAFARARGDAGRVAVSASDRLGPRTSDELGGDGGDGDGGSRSRADRAPSGPFWGRWEPLPASELAMAAAMAEASAVADAHFRASGATARGCSRERRARRRSRRRREPAGPGRFRFRETKKSRRARTRRRRRSSPGPPREIGGGGGGGAHGGGGGERGDVPEARARPEPRLGRLRVRPRESHRRRRRFGVVARGGRRRDERVFLRFAERFPRELSRGTRGDDDPRPGSVRARRECESGVVAAGGFAAVSAVLAALVLGRGVAGRRDDRALGGGRRRGERPRGEPPRIGASPRILADEGAVPGDAREGREGRRTRGRRREGRRRDGFSEGVFVPRDPFGKGPPRGAGRKGSRSETRRRGRLRLLRVGIRGDPRRDASAGVDAREIARPLRARGGAPGYLHRGPRHDLETPRVREVPPPRRRAPDDVRRRAPPPPPPAPLAQPPPPPRRPPRPPPARRERERARRRTTRGPRRRRRTGARAREIKERRILRILLASRGVAEDQDAREPRRLRRRVGERARAGPRAGREGEGRGRVGLGELSVRLRPRGGAKVRRRSPRGECGGGGARATRRRGAGGPARTRSRGTPGTSRPRRRARRRRARSGFRAAAAAAAAAVAAGRGRRGQVRDDGPAAPPLPPGAPPPLPPGPPPGANRGGGDGDGPPRAPRRGTRSSPRR